MMLGRALAATAAVLALSAATGPADNAVHIERVRADVKFLSSDALEGRLSLDRSADVAAQYIAAEFEKAGLKPANGDSFLQPFVLTAYRPDTQAQSLELIRNGESKVFRPRVDYTGGFVEDVTIKAPLVFVGYGITAPEYGYDDYTGIDVKAQGGCHDAPDHEPQETDPKSVFNGTGHTVHGARSTKLMNAQEHGSGAAPIASEPLRSTGFFEHGPSVAQRTARSAQRDGAGPGDRWLDHDSSVLH